MKKLSVIILVLVLVVGMVGCGQTAPSNQTASASPSATASAAATESAKPQELEQVTLKMFAIMDAPKNQELSDQFFVELNKRLTEALHCTIELDYAAGNDYKNNYELAVASGEKYDLMHAASGWLDYQKYALDGAFLPLDDLIPQYAPYLNSKIPAEKWEAVKVKGKIYGVPNLKTSWVKPAFMYREDIRKKYNLPPVDSYEHIGTYLQGIVDHSAELGGMLPSNDYQSQVYGTSFIYTTPYMGIDEISDRHFNFVINPKEPTKVLSVIETPEYKEYMYTMKKWADAGYWPSSCLTNIDWGVMSVISGKAAASFNAQLPNYAWHVPYIEGQNPGWEIGYFFYFEDPNNKDAVVRSQSATKALTAVARTAENPERALMFVDYIQQNKDLWTLCNYGIEGVNYKMNNGRLDTTEINEDTNGFNYFPGSLFGNSEFELVDVNQWVRYDEYVKKLQDRTVENILDGFVLDTSEFDAEYTALYNVMIEFGYPLQAGLVDDVDAAYEKYLKAAKDAGLEKCRAGVEKQIQAFLSSKK